MERRNEDIWQEILRLLKPDPDSIEEIRGEFEFFAGDLLAGLETSAVRSKDLMNSLTAAQTLMIELAKTLSRYESDLEEAMGNCAHDGVFDDQHASTVFYYSTLDLLDPAELEQVAQILARRQSTLANALGISVESPDRGGAALSVRLLGTPKRRFLRNIFPIWAGNRHDAIAEDNSQLVEFCELLWEWATGESEVAGLRDDLRWVIRYYKKFWDLHRRHIDALNILVNFQRMNFAAAAQEQFEVIADIERELAEFSHLTLPGELPENS